jgi:Bacterial aa3 type cytochrome c oxidase subunit IV
MAMTFDPEVERHRRTWIGFTRFVKFGTAAVVILLILLAIFLL